MTHFFSFLKFGVKVFIDSSRWDEWQTFEKKIYLDIEK